MPRSLTLDDIFATDYISDPQLSPSGDRIAFTVACGHTQGDEKLPRSSIWLVPFDGGEPPRRLTYGPRADAQPRWRPDGCAFAFLSDRDKGGSSQVYLLPLDGGEARRLTQMKTGVASMQWSPDGKRIAFLARDGDTEEEEKRKKEKDDAVRVDRDYKFTRLWVVDAEAPGAEPRAVTPAEYEVRSFAWYGDGWAVLTSRTPTEDEWVGWKLLRLRADGATEQLWQLRYGSSGLAQGGDGSALAWIDSGTDAAGSANELWIVAPGGVPRLLAQDYSGGMEWAGWLPGDDALLVTAVDGVHMALGRVPLAGGPVEPRLTGRTLGQGAGGLCEVSVSADGRRMACTVGNATHPWDVWAGELGGEPRQVTRFNEHLRDVTLGKAEILRWPAPDGLEIEGIVIHPWNYAPGQRCPLIVEAHGGPSWQWLDRYMANWHDWAQWLSAQGFAVLLPNPRGSTGRGRAFNYANHRNWGEGDLGDFLSGVDALIARGVADPERLGISGWSYGGYITAWAIGHTDRFKAAMVGAGVTDLLSFMGAEIPSWLPRQEMLAQPYEDQEIYLRCSPVSYAGDVQTPTLFIHGEQDVRVPPGQAYELYHVLRGRGVAAEMVVYPREGHGFGEMRHQRDLLERMAEWFKRWL